MCSICSLLYLALSLSLSRFTSISPWTSGNLARGSSWIPIRINVHWELQRRIYNILWPCKRFMKNSNSFINTLWPEWSLETCIRVSLWTSWLYTCWPLVGFITIIYKWEHKTLLKYGSAAEWLKCKRLQIVKRLVELGDPVVVWKWVLVWNDSNTLLHTRDWGDSLPICAFMSQYNKIKRLSSWQVFWFGLWAITIIIRCLSLALVCGLGLLLDVNEGCSSALTHGLPAKVVCKCIWPRVRSSRDLFLLFRLRRVSKKWYSEVGQTIIWVAAWVYKTWYCGVSLQPKEQGLEAEAYTSLLLWGSLCLWGVICWGHGCCDKRRVWMGRLKTWGVQL